MVCGVVFQELSFPWKDLLMLWHNNTFLYRSFWDILDAFSLIWRRLTLSSYNSFQSSGKTFCKILDGLWEFSSSHQENHFLRSDSDIDERVWLTISFAVHFKGVQCGSDWCWSSSMLDSSNHHFTDLALCTGAKSCWNRKGPSPSCYCDVGSIEQPKCLGKLKHWDLPSLKGAKVNPRKTTQQHHNFLTKLYGWSNTVRQVMFLWHSSPDSSIRLPERKE